MSEATAEDQPPPKAQSLVHETRQPFDLSDELQAKVDALDLGESVAHVKAEGYGYIYDPAPLAFTERLRDAILRTAPESEGPRGTNMLLDKDPVFAEVALNPKLLAMVEILCGKGALLSQVTSTVIPKQADAPRKGGLHADQTWTPAPFPEHNQTATFCWACDEYTQEGGSRRGSCPTPIGFAATPRRRKSPQRTASSPRPVRRAPSYSGTAPSGTAGGTRTIGGERVVLHITFSRLAMRPIENYDFLGEDWLADKPYEMRVLLGREDFLNKGGTMAHMDKIVQTMNWAKNLASLRPSKKHRGPTARQLDPTANHNRGHARKQAEVTARASPTGPIRRRTLLIPPPCIRKTGDVLGFDGGTAEPIPVHRPRFRPADDRDQVVPPKERSIDALDWPRSVRRCAVRRAPR